MYTGRVGAYNWIEDDSLSIADVLDRCPEFVLGKYLVITSFDGGPPPITGEEFKNRWIRHNELAINPSVKSTADIPRGNRGEWFIFTSTPLLEHFKVFVNYPSFSLRGPDYEGPARPGAGGRGQAEELRGLQELFWLQIELKGAESYIADGNGFVLVTRDLILYERFTRSIVS